MIITDGEFALNLRFNADLRALAAEANATIHAQNASIRALKTEVARLRGQVATECAGRLFAEGQLVKARRQ